MSKNNFAFALRQKVRQISPLIHCITNPISINDCANIILAVGAKPIMAEHPDEAADITSGAGALLLNLGNISDIRIRSMELSAARAKEREIPIVIDLVGVGCSRLRLDFAARLINKYNPAIIKGNSSELTALWENRLTARGVDAEADRSQSLADLATLTREMSVRWGAVTMMSGAIDIISSPEVSVANHTGHKMLGELTGTGCMLGALTATLAATGDFLGAAVESALIEGIAGEKAAAITKGIGSFRADFFDFIYNLTDKELISAAKWEELK